MGRTVAHQVPGASLANPDAVAERLNAPVELVVRPSASDRSPPTLSSPPKNASGGLGSYEASGGEAPATGAPHWYANQVIVANDVPNVADSVVDEAREVFTGAAIGQETGRLVPTRSPPPPLSPEKETEGAETRGEPPGSLTSSPS